MEGDRNEEFLKEEESGVGFGGFDGDNGSGDEYRGSIGLLSSFWLSVMVLLV